MSHLRLIVNTPEGPREDLAPRVQVRPMVSDDLDAAKIIANRGFINNAFYRDLLGLDVRQFRTYWERFLPFVLDHPDARTFVLEVEGEPRGILAVALNGFASPLRGCGFAAGLAFRIAPGAWTRYLGFVQFYEHLMRVPPGEQDGEARGLWLAVDRRAGDPPLGSLLVRNVMERLAAEGRPMATGMADGKNRAILTFYRRLGFELQDPVFFRGCCVVRVVARPGREG